MPFKVNRNTVACFLIVKSYLYSLLIIILYFQKYKPCEGLIKKIILCPYLSRPISNNLMKQSSLKLVDDWALVMFTLYSYKYSYITWIRHGSDGF